MPETTATTRLMRSGLRRRVEVSPYPGQLPVNNDRTQGTCSYYPPDAGGCRAPRSCYDCLNVELEKEPEGCMINEVGRCVSIAGNYDVAFDFRVVSAAQRSESPTSSTNEVKKEPPPPRSLSTQKISELEFPAVNTTYCDAGDSLFNEDELADAGFIFGTGGCVFVEVCEVPDWAYIVGGSDCSRLAATDSSGSIGDNNPMDRNISGDSSQGHLVFWCVAVAIILTLVATLGMVITIRHHHAKRRLEESLRRRTIVVGEPIASTAQSMAPKSSKKGVRLLDLFGWEAMRADLIEKERQEMQERLCVNVIPVSESSLPGESLSTNYLQLVGTQPSAPLMSPTVPSAPRLTDC